MMEKEPAPQEWKKVSLRVFLLSMLLLFLCICSATLVEEIARGYPQPFYVDRKYIQINPDTLIEELENGDFDLVILDERPEVTDHEKYATPPDLSADEYLQMAQLMMEEMWSEPVEKWMRIYTEYSVSVCQDGSADLYGAEFTYIKKDPKDEDAMFTQEISIYTKAQFIYWDTTNELRWLPYPIYLHQKYKIEWQEAIQIALENGMADQIKYDEDGCASVDAKLIFRYFRSIWDIRFTNQEDYSEWIAFNASTGKIIDR